MADDLRLVVQAFDGAVVDRHFEVVQDVILMAPNFTLSHSTT